MKTDPVGALGTSGMGEGEWRGWRRANIVDVF
jgi:hypothetical protein